MTTPVTPENYGKTMSDSVRAASRASSEAQVSSPFGPIVPDGALPPGLRAETVSRAFRACAGHLRPKKMHDLLGRRPEAEDLKESLRMLMDDPACRAGRSTGRKDDVPALHFALWNFLKQFDTSARIYETFIQPAEEDRDGLSFIVVDRFVERLKPASRDWKFNEVTQCEPDSAAETLALFVLAYGLLQPGDARDLVAPLVALSPAFGRFFGVGSEAVVTTEMDVDVDRLNGLFDAASEALRKAADDFAVRRTLPDEQSYLAVAEAETAFQNARQRISEKARALGRALEDSALSDIPSLAAALSTIATSDDARESARQCLRRLLTLQRRDGRRSAAIEALLADATNELAILDDGDAELLATFEADTHPGPALIRLVSELDTLSEEDEEALRERVKSRWGGELAKLSSRGFLVLDAGPVPPRDPAPDDGPAAEPDTAPINEEPQQVATATRDPEAVEVAEPWLVDSVPPDAEPKVSVESTLPHVESVRADAAASAADNVDPATAFDVAWEALASGRSDLGYQIALTAELLGKLEPGPLPSALAKCVVLAPILRPGDTDLIEAYRSATASVYDAVFNAEQLPQAYAEAIRLVAVAAALRPALLAPLCQANLILEAVDDAGALDAVKRQVLEFTRRHFELNPSLLKGVREHASWSALRQRHLDRCRAWLTGERQSKLVYVAATDVWRQWVSQTGFIGAAFDKAEKGKLAQEELLQTIETCADRDVLLDLMDRTDQQLRAKVPERRSIEGMARQRLLTHAREAAVLLQQLQDLEQARPDLPADFRRKEIESFRKDVSEELVKIGKELAPLAKSDQAPLRCAATVTLPLLRSLEALFDPDASEPTSSPSVQEALDDVLVYVPSIALDGENQPYPARSSETLAALCKEARSNATTEIAAFESRLEDGEFDAADRILDGLASKADETEVERLRRRHAEAVRAATSALRGTAAAVEGQLQQAVWYDLLTESELLALQPQVSLDLTVQVGAVRPMRERLQSVARVIQTKRAQRAEQVRDRLTRATHLEGQVVQRVEAALAEGNFSAANEYIDLGLQGLALDPEPSDDPLREFFPGFVNEIQKFLKDKDQAAVIDNIRKGLSQGPLDMTRVTGAQAAEAAGMLDAWYRAKGRSSGWKSGLTDVFRALGFLAPEIKGGGSPTVDRLWVGELHATPIADREVCVIPHFGSSARGHYKLSCAWNGPSEEEILNSTAHHGGAQIVIYFGCMTEQRRRDLATLSRRRRRALLLIDECLIYFLCGARGARLPLLFQCSLPFATVDPYITTGSLVPPEMFFGRTIEKERILNPYGTNLVYGGRQLGKTALLRDIQRSHHKPADGFIVKWIDLVYERIAIARPTSDVWLVIAKALEGEGILKTGTKVQETIVHRIEAWLSDAANRRILLLLDEADEFLRIDGQEGFEQLARLKGLMDRTDRRFKVVFAGLHNVQRTSRSVNSPLGHLGDPVCVGPLLAHGGARDAMELIHRPLESLGYRFEPGDLPRRILSHTNYYPSLIQVFCKHLLEQLSDATRTHFDSKQAPPYLIGPSHVDAAHNAELRLKIQSKFHLTLELDLRYKLIALCIAMDGGPEGMDPASVRNQALSWWEAGFEDDSSVDAIAVLLDEMVGLGILRKTESHYALRSPNLVNLLGTQREIEDQLMGSASWSKPTAYDAGSFRRECDGEPWRRSPLTAFQESDLLTSGPGVSVIFGNRLSGLDEVEEFLLLAAEQKPLVIDAHDSGAFGRALRNHLDELRDGLSLIIVPHRVPWSETWVIQAADELSRRSSRKRLARIVFVGDAEQAWHWAGLDPSVKAKMIARDVRELSLKPWSRPAVRPWMEAIGVGTPGANDEIEKRTGNWHSLMMQFGDLTRVAPYHWKEQLTKIEQVSADPAWRSELGLVPEAERVLSVCKVLDQRVSVDEICDVEPSLDRSSVGRVAQWLLLMSYSSGREGELQLDPFISSMIALHV